MIFVSRLQQISKIQKKKKIYCWFSFKTSIVGVFLIFSTCFLRCALICCTFEGSWRVWARGVLVARVVVFHADRVRLLVTTLSRQRGGLAEPSVWQRCWSMTICWIQTQLVHVRSDNWPGQRSIGLVLESDSNQSCTRNECGQTTRTLYVIDGVG